MRTQSKLTLYTCVVSELTLKNSLVFDFSIYLDYNATTPLSPEVLEIIQSTLSEAWGNPASSHPTGISNIVRRLATDPVAMRSSPATGHIRYILLANQP